MDDNTKSKEVAEQKTNRIADFRKRNPNTMFRIDAKGYFVEFIAPHRVNTSGEDFYKVTINIVNYDETTNKQKYMNTFYMSVEQFKELLNYIKNYRLQSDVLKLQGDYDTVKNWELFSGSSENECRKLYFTKSSLTKPNEGKFFVRLYIENGRGKKNKEGTYIIDSKNARRLALAISFSSLMQMALQCSDRLLAYEVECQLAGLYSSSANNVPNLISDIAGSMQGIIREAVAGAVKVAVESIMSNYNVASEKNEETSKEEIKETVNETTLPHVEDAIPSDDIPLETGAVEETDGNNAEVNPYATIVGEELGIADFE